MQRHEWRYRALILAFCGFIGAFATLYWLLPGQDFSEKEKRVLSALPKLTGASVLDGSAESALEAWMSDHVPGRDALVGLNARYELMSGRNGLNGVIRDGEGRLVAAPAAMDRAELLDKCERINALAQKIDRPVSLLLIPESGYIREALLPRLHATYHDGEAAQLIAQALDGVDFIWPEARFRALDADALYYRTDHHFTSRGAWEACVLYAQSLGLALPDRSEYDVQAVDGFRGSQYAKSGLWDTPAEAVELWRGPAEAGVQVVCDDRPPANSMFFPEHLADMDKYPVFLDGNHALVTITTGHGGENLLIVRDSFGHCFAPFAAECFGKVVLVDLRYYHRKLSQLVEDARIDRVLVLYGMDTFMTDSNFGWLK